ncbi:type I-E CRISPR-associated protein Cse2/CasB [Thioalkalivibrio thiocyanodenitrificans]|uniref:type I-E CRISPR-associated protein Cse2/CasB n=1 Tax=Thioalkalivibrio thiocyanodenitrificans TaxID=243063 RepID=UPI000363322F|nr:type I-E CRISPR-associated protein Cse2/CasB [Thioalkalivibrio thiocyanodenitrificans]
MTSVTDAAPDEQGGEHKPGLPALVGRIAALFSSAHYPSSDRAALKRWAPGQPTPLAYYRLWMCHLRQDPPSDSQTMAWSCVAWALASAGGASHQPSRPLGQALAEARFSEARLEQMLSAPEEVRARLCQAAVRFLAAKGERWNFSELAHYLLTRDAEKREAVNRRIASSYYRHSHTVG